MYIYYMHITSHSQIMAKCHSMVSHKLRETDNGKVLFCTKRRGTCKGAQYLCCGVYTYVYI